MSIKSKYPTIHPTLLIDFANSRSIDPRLNFTRASAATRTNERGLIETVASNIPRIDFDPVSGDCKGLLIEESRTNLLTYSEQFDNAAWSALIGGTGVAPSITPNSIVAPDGATTADRVVFNTGGGVTESDQSAIRQLVTTELGKIYAGSLWLKGEVGGEKIVIRHAANTNYTLITLTTAWQRFSVIETGAATTSTYFTIGIRQGQVGIGTINPSAAVHIWGAQLEAGSTPTSYIPTTSSAATRAADAVSMSGTNFSSWYRQDEGTLIIYRTDAAFNTTGVSEIAIRNDAGENQVQLRQGTVITGVDMLVVNNGSTVVDTASFAITKDVSYKAALAFKKDDFAFSVNGSAAITDITGDLGALTRMQFAKDVCSTYQRIAYYPKRLKNAELQALSAQ